MSSVPEPRQDRSTVADAIAGLLAAGSIFLSFIAMGFGLILQVESRPARLAPVAIIAALVAGRMSVRYSRLAFVAVVVGMVAWVVGMALAVITHHPLI
ncbi:MAG TPA: hypothetical protein VEH79_01465 [Gaiellaceae bacterium]|nr:hypothetical protein [Gaiellaceae bacterium]